MTITLEPKQSIEDWLVNPDTLVVTNAKLEDLVDMVMGVTVAMTRVNETTNDQ